MQCLRNLPACLVLVLAVGLIQTGSLLSQEPETKAAAPDKKLPIPDAAARKTAAKDIKALYGKKLAKAKTAANKIELAKKLFQVGIDSKNDPTNRYVLFRISKDIAASAGDAVTAFHAIDQLDKFYKIDAFAMKCDTLSKAAKYAKTKDAAKIIVEKATPLIEDCVKKNKYDLAKELGKIALAAARKVKDLDSAKEIVERNREIAVIAREYEKVRTAFVTLETKPSDSTANMEVGKFYCLAKGDWQKGLAMLALGSDATLQSLAVKELEEPKAADYIVLGNGWWEQSAKAKGLAKKQLKAHAAIWYRKALPKLSGLPKVRVTQRLAELAPKTAIAKKLTAKEAAAMRAAAKRKLAAQQAAAIRAAPKHPAGAVQFQGHWYILIPGNVPWSTAVQQCRRLGGQLVCIETGAEAQFVARLAGGNKVWLGGFRNARGQWMWVNGKPMTFTIWKTGEPNNQGGTENCLDLQNGTWEDLGNKPRVGTEPGGYICEWVQ